MNSSDSTATPEVQGDPEKVIVFTGSGVSAPSGIPTFRGADGLWRRHRVEDVASPIAWQRHPELVLEFYNERRARAASAQPNAAHVAIADLQRRFKVTVVTQNVDDLHERAGSKDVIHLHGELRKARSTADPSLIHDIADAPISMGDHCALGSQLRPHIVWFGEEVMHYWDAKAHIEAADRLLVVGTSLLVFPAAGLVEYADKATKKIHVDIDAQNSLDGFESIAGSADVVLPRIAAKWLGENPGK